MRPRQRQHGRPVRRAFGALCVEPQVAQQVQHHRRRVQPRLDQRQPGHRAHLQVELRHVARVDRVVAGVVRARRHLVGDERAVFEDEELDAQHADIAQVRRDARRAADGLGLQRGRAGRCGHGGHGQDAVAVQVLLQREGDHAPVAATRDQHADLEGQRQALFQHADRAAEFRPASSEFRPVGDADLALAVVAHAGSLQDAGQQVVADRGQRSFTVDHRIRRHGHTAVGEMRLLGGAVLAHGHRVA